MKLLPSLFRPLCTQQPKTSSFRMMATKDDIYKTLNSVYFNPESDWVETPESWFTNSSEPESPWSSSMTTDVEDNESHVEAVVRGAQQSSLNNHRLIFDPGEGESDSPRLQTPKLENELFKKSVAMSVDSDDPYEDFKRSMEEMVECLGVRDHWEGLEELLRWYLKVNGKETHDILLMHLLI
ncbi:Transcription repressor OFP13 [Bienertia sinuspersici]